MCFVGSLKSIWDLHVNADSDRPNGEVLIDSDHILPIFRGESDCINPDGILPTAGIEPKPRGVET